MPMPSRYSPARAWQLGSAWFAFCLAVSWQSGVFELLVVDRWFEPAQLADIRWWLATALVSAHVGFAYVYYWPRGTTHHGRPRRPLWSPLFGFLWGATQSQLVLAVWYALASLPVARIWIVIAMVLIYSLWSGVWQSQFWDRYVSPDHNIREWNIRKVLIAHLPFLVLSLIHLALFDNPMLFVIWQTVALVASSWAMRFPAPGDPDAPPHDGLGVPLADIERSKTTPE